MYGISLASDHIPSLIKLHWSLTSPMVSLIYRCVQYSIGVVLDRSNGARQVMRTQIISPFLKIDRWDFLLASVHRWLLNIFNSLHRIGKL